MLEQTNRHDWTDNKLFSPWFGEPANVVSLQNWTERQTNDAKQTSLWQEQPQTDKTTRHLVEQTLLNDNSARRSNNGANNAILNNLIPGVFACHEQTQTNRLLNAYVSHTAVSFFRSLRFQNTFSIYKDILYITFPTVRFVLRQAFQVNVFASTKTWANKTDSDFILGGGTFSPST